MNYINTFTVESVAKKGLITLEGKKMVWQLESNMIEFLGREILDKLKLLNEDINTNFHSSLSEYNDLFFRVNNENLCKEVFETNTELGYQGESCDSSILSF